MRTKSFAFLLITSIATLSTNIAKSDNASNAVTTQSNTRSAHSIGTLSTFGLIGYRYTHLGSRFSPFLTVGLISTSLGVEISPSLKHQHLAIELHLGEHSTFSYGDVKTAGFNVIWDKNGKYHKGPALGVGLAYLKDYRSCSFMSCQGEAKSVWAPSFTYYFKL